MTSSLFVYTKIAPQLLLKNTPKTPYYTTPMTRKMNESNYLEPRKMSPERLQPQKVGSIKMRNPER